jgi:protein-tyrosine-phosphatase
MTQEPAPGGAKAILRRFVPDVLLKEREIIQHLGPKAGRVYVRLRLLDALGIRASNQRLAHSSARSLVFVCWGNIMRSAMAEFLMRRALREAGLTGQVQIISAGLHATAGREAHPWAREASVELGISLTEHRAKPLTLEMVERADCIFAMDFQNKAELLTLYPAFREKICMLSAYSDGPGRYREIRDPYLEDLAGTVLCGRQLQTCICNLMRSLFPASLPNGGKTAVFDSRQPGRNAGTGCANSAAMAEPGRTRG